MNMAAAAAAAAAALLLASATLAGDRMLDPQEQTALGQLACQGPHRVAADDIVLQPDEHTGLGAATAIVRCHPRGRIDGYVTRYRTRCEKTDLQWRCEPAQFALVIPVGSRKVDLVIHGRISAGRAVSLLRYAARVAQFGVEDTTGWVQDVCELRALDASSWELACGSARLQIAEDCVGNRCKLRMFLAERIVVSSAAPTRGACKEQHLV